MTENLSRRDVMSWLGALGAGALASNTVVAEKGSARTKVSRRRSVEFRQILI